jgi:hypothetical protein
LTSHRRRVRVKFAYSFDNDRVLPITQTTVIKTEPCFEVIAIEDQAAKYFYQNKLKKHGNTQFIEKKPSIESDSLEEEDPPPSIVSFANMKKKFFFMNYSFRKKKQQLSKLVLLNNHPLIEHFLLLLLGNRS